MRAFLFLACSAACGTTADYVTKQGFPVYLNGSPGPGRSEMNMAIDNIVAVLRQKKLYTDKQLKRALSKWAHRVEIQIRENDDHGFWCGTATSPTGYCWGRFDQNALILETVFQPCIASSAIGHELIHFFNWAIGHYMDYNHADSRFFAQGCRSAVPDDQEPACMRASAERTSNMLICEALCGDLCTGGE